MLEILVPMLGHAFRFATPENEWQQLFVPFLPEWLTVSDPSLLSGYYEGELPLYTAETLLGWATPVLWWTAFITVLIFGMLCINIIVRKQWIEHEKLSYPIIQLPLQLTETPQNRLFQKQIDVARFWHCGRARPLERHQLFISNFTRIQNPCAELSKFLRRARGMLWVASRFHCIRLQSGSVSLSL